MKRYLVHAMRVSKPGKMRQTLKAHSQLEAIEKALENAGEGYVVTYAEELRGK